MVIRVVAAFICKDNKVFMVKRTTGNALAINKWEFPGGKVELGESEETAIEREMKEEFLVKVKAIKYLTNCIYDYPNRSVDLRLYECTHEKGDFVMQKDHSDMKWIPIKEILNYDLVPADISLAKFIQQKVLTK